MTVESCDALVFFGATGDLAYKKIFPALLAMVKRGALDVPVIGVAKSGWGLEQLKARARDSIEKHTSLDAAAFAKLMQLLRYVDGDYAEAATFTSLRKLLGAATRPAHYLAIPPTLFGTVVQHLAQANCTPPGSRVVVEKPFGRDLASARNLNGILQQTFDEQHIFRIDHFLGKGPVRNMAFFRFTNAFMESFWHRQHVESVQLTMAEDFGIQGRGAFYEQTGAIRDVVQNHLFQVLATLTMEPPARIDSESIRDEKVKVLKSITPIETHELIRGQFRGYRQEPGVAADSRVETYAALRLGIDSWRWQGVPFFIRTGKLLPVTCTEVFARLRRPPALFPTRPAPNYLRVRIGPTVDLAMGVNVMDPEDKGEGSITELLASRHPGSNDIDAYERVLTDAMEGDPTLFARMDYIEEAWRIVDPVVRAGTPLYEYEPGTWGPKELASVTPPGGWHDPVVAAEHARQA
jgi:glucose-6-phosphate 1-dehydrogenase